MIPLFASNLDELLLVILISNWTLIHWNSLLHRLIRTNSLWTSTAQVVFKATFITDFHLLPAGNRWIHLIKLMKVITNSTFFLAAHRVVVLGFFLGYSVFYQELWSHMCTILESTHISLLDGEINLASYLYNEQSWF